VIRQDLPHDVFFGVDRARIETIFDGASERDDAERENRDSQQNLVQGEGAMKISDLAPVIAQHKS